MPSKSEKPPLSVTHPELAKEADGWDPTLVHYSNSQPLAWKCKFDHRWFAKPRNRTGNGLNVEIVSCPTCSGTIPEKGTNDFKTLYPKVASEALGWDPSSFFPGSNRKMDWRCRLGHTWKAVIYERAIRNSGCPYCTNSKVWPGFNDLATLFPNIAAEAEGWDPSKVNPGSHKKYFWRCPDGHQFSMQVVLRTTQGQRCSVCANRKIISGINDLASKFPQISEQADGWDPSKIGSGSHKKLNWKCNLGHKWKASVGDMTTRKNSCPFCSNHKLLSGFNDVKTLFPDIAKEADGWDPSKVHSGTRAKKNWKCNFEHKWNATINSRTKLGAGCPYCSGTSVWPGFNDLVTTHPDIAHQAFQWDPSKYSAGSAIKKKWKCTEGHIWVTAINVRGGSGCPTCAISGFDPNQPAHLYFLTQDEWCMFQIGITNDIKRRLQEHKKNGWELLEIRGPIDGHLAQRWETAILRMLKAKCADLSNSRIAGKFDGYSESWSKSTFDVKSIRELMDLTEIFEEAGD